MIRLAAVASAIVLAGVPLQAMPILVVAVFGAIGVVLTALGIVTRWRWPVTAAACVFVTDYAVALWVAGSSVNLAAAAAFGLALLGLLHGTELARCAHRASVGSGVARAHARGWMILAGVTAGSAMLAMALARGVAAALPVAVAPLVAAAGALGVVVALAAAVRSWALAPKS